jgi:GNAT superfamily N-acetyltransferase
MVPRTAPGLARHGGGVDNPPMTVTPVAVRTARPDELAALQDIEVAAGALFADVVDGNAHIGQVSVHPRHGHRGIGRTLIEFVKGWATGQGLPALTLTTFTDVPWNGPYYRRCGFRPIPESELGPELAALLGAERARGLEHHPRLAMIKAQKSPDLA